MKPEHLRTVDLGHGVAVMVDSVIAGSSNEATLAGDDERVRAPQTSPRRCPEDQGMPDPCDAIFGVSPGVPAPFSMVKSHFVVEEYI